MAFATQATIGAGTILEYETSPGGSTFAQLNYARDLPALGSQGSFVDVTPIQELTTVYAAGLQQTEEVEIVLFDVPGDSDHEAFIDMAKASATVLMRFTYPSGRIGEVDFVLNGSRVNPPEREEGATITVYAQQRGAVAWSEAA